jgi:hypothetical protein
MNSTVSNLSIGATLFCVYATGAFAARLRNTPKLFMAMVLLTFTWALVILYWSTSEPVTKDRIGVYTSFLSICIASLLAAYDEELRGPRKWSLLGAAQLIVQYGSIPLLYFVATGQYFSVFDSSQVAGVAELALGVIGFGAIALSGWKLLGTRASLTLILFVFLPYTIFNLAGAIQRFPSIVGSAPYASFIVGYSVHAAIVLKLLYTVLFGSFIAYVALDEDGRLNGIWKYIGKVFRVPAPPTPPLVASSREILELSKFVHGHVATREDIAAVMNAVEAQRQGERST